MKNNGQDITNAKEFEEMTNEFNSQYERYKAISNQRKCFQPIQAEQLKAQIFAFKNYISKNLQLPKCLYDAVQGIEIEKNLNVKNTLNKGIHEYENSKPKFIKNPNHRI
jgi:phosphopantetheinyl transferase (holo-ACP synthase)